MNEFRFVQKQFPMTHYGTMIGIPLKIAHIWDMLCVCSKWSRFSNSCASLPLTLNFIEKKLFDLFSSPFMLEVIVLVCRNRMAAEVRLEFDRMRDRSYSASMIDYTVVFQERGPFYSKMRATQNQSLKKYFSIKNPEKV